MHKLAQDLNDVLQQENPAILRMLSRKGREIYFPKGGILGQSAQAKGKKYNATIGIATEDDGSPMHLPVFDAFNSALSLQDVYPYAPSYGREDLRKAWKAQIAIKNPSFQSAMSMPIVTSGLTHALSVAGSLFLDEGDEIIVPDKHWDNYALTFGHQFGATLKTYNTFNNDGYDLDALREALATAAGTKRVVLLNFPNNPSGYTLKTNEIKPLCDMLYEHAERGNDVVALLDDAYFGLVYEDGVERESLFSHLGALHERILAVKVDGSSKEEYNWGSRVAFITYASKGLRESALKALEDKTAGVVRESISNVSNLTQSQLRDALLHADYPAQKERNFNVLKARYQAVKAALSQADGEGLFTPLPFNSGYFFCVELAPKLDAEKVRLCLLEHYDTGVIALGNLIRIAFSSMSEKDIPQVITNLCAACRDVSSSS